MKGFGMNKKGVSPVIATIIIVAVATVMSIAVAGWVLGLGANMTRYEIIQFKRAYAPSTTEVDIVLKNTGSALATLDSKTVFANGHLIPPDDVVFTAGANCTDNLDGTFTMAAGGEVTGVITLNGYSSGATVEIMIQTTAGYQYPKIIVL